MALQDPAGLYAPTQDDLEAMEWNRQFKEMGNSVLGILGQLPAMRKQRKINDYWRRKDSSINAPITVGEGGNLIMDSNDLTNMSFGSMTDEWNNYKSFLKGKNVRVTDEDYIMFKEQYALKAQEYGNTLANKFSSMKLRGVKDSKIRDLVSGNLNLRDTMSRVGQVNPEAAAQFAPYLKAKEGLIGGLQGAVPKTLQSAATWYGIPAAIAGYGVLRKGKPFAQAFKSASGLNIAEKIGKKMGASDEILKAAGKKWGGNMDTKLVNRKRNILKKAKSKADNLYTKTGKLKKGVTIAQVNKAETAAKKADTIFRKVPKAAKMQPIKIVKNVIKTKGIGGLYRMLTKSVGKSAAMKLMLRAGLGTALSGTGVGTAVGIGLNAWAAYDIATALGSALQEVEPGTAREMVWGADSGSSTLEGSEF